MVGRLTCSLISLARTRRIQVHSWPCRLNSLIRFTGLGAIKWSRSFLPTGSRSTYQTYDAMCGCGSRSHPNLECTTLSVVRPLALQPFPFGSSNTGLLSAVHQVRWRHLCVLAQTLWLPAASTFRAATQVQPEWAAPRHAAWFPHIQHTSMLPPVSYAVPSMLLQMTNSSQKHRHSWLIASSRTCSLHTMQSSGMQLSGNRSGQQPPLQPTLLPLDALC